MDPICPRSFAPIRCVDSIVVLPICRCISREVLGCHLTWPSSTDNLNGPPTARLPYDTIRRRVSAKLRASCEATAHAMVHGVLRTLAARLKVTGPIMPPLVALMETPSANCSSLNVIELSTAARCMSFDHKINVSSHPAPLTVMVIEPLSTSSRAEKSKPACSVPP